LFYSHLNLDSYTETGAGALNLSVSPRDTTVVQLGIGPKISTIVGYSGAAIVPEIHAQYIYDMNHDKQQTTSQFINGFGPQFLTEGNDRMPSSYNVGFSISAYGYKSLVFVAAYDYEYRISKLSGNHGYLKFKYIW
jgi:uncharacterized protein with beta-barrel porin domain